MSNSSHATPPHAAPSDDEVDEGRRNLLVATCVAGGAATAAVAWPFLASMQPSEWAKFVDVNLYGVLHCTRAVVAGMCERGFGRIVTIASGAGVTGSPMGISVYGAGKGGAS